MSRLHADPVEVRTAPAPEGPVPEQFLWRGRLYLVRDVLARWTASGPWWRVEADSGRLAGLSGGRGTYDLCFSWRTGWSLTRVLD
jgi:hypothetical protein